MSQLADGNQSVTHVSADDTASNEVINGLLCCSCESASVTLNRAAVSLRMFDHDALRTVEVRKCLSVCR